MIIGIDEVGRGPWAGPLVAGAVALSRPIDGLRDSKKLSKKRRQQLAATIKVEALACGLGWVTPAEIDAVGMTKAVTLAMERAVQSVLIDCPNYEQIIIDGNINYLPDNPKATYLIKADDSVPAVSAASIIAKVARDKYMEDASLQFPDYGFEKHVGYGTAVHRDALQLLGPCPLHRMSFAPLKNLV